LYPGQFQSLTGVAIDKNNRVITTEQFAGRAQIFRYFTNTEALAEKDRRDAEAKKKVEERRAALNASKSGASAEKKD
jgi:hypothetical protein